MQVIPFSNGGFVAHKVQVPGCISRCSAWYDSNNRLLDAELFDGRDRPRPVIRNGSVWRYLDSIGARISPDTSCH